MLLPTRGSREDAGQAGFGADRARDAQLVRSLVQGQPAGSRHDLKDPRKIAAAVHSSPVATIGHLTKARLLEGRARQTRRYMVRQGMGATLQIASEKGGYTLTDNATWLANRDKLDLDAVVTADAKLLNPYHVILVNPEKWPKVNADGAKAFSDFLLSAEGQEMIGEFGVDTFGEQLFVPDAGKTEDQPVRRAGAPGAIPGSGSP
jgi:hypothetical protein